MKTEPVTAARHRHTKSTSSVQHAPIPDPIYPVRSQPIGLSRSNSLASSSSFPSMGDLASQVEPPTVKHEKKAPLSPTISGGLVRSLSVSSISGSEADEPERDEQPRQRRPFYTHRSESLPSLPPPPLEPQQSRNGPSEDELASLPVRVFSTCRFAACAQHFA